jgi:hypothetical protein
MKSGIIIAGVALVGISLSKIGCGGMLAICCSGKTCVEVCTIFEIKKARAFSARVQSLPGKFPGHNDCFRSSVHIESEARLFLFV